MIDPCNVSAEFLQISVHQKLLKSLHFWPSYSRNNGATFSGTHTASTLYITGAGAAAFATATSPTIERVQFLSTCVAKTARESLNLILPTCCRRGRAQMTLAGITKLLYLPPNVHLYFTTAGQGRLYYDIGLSGCSVLSFSLYYLALFEHRKSQIKCVGLYGRLPGGKPYVKWTVINCTAPRKHGDISKYHHHHHHHHHIYFPRTTQHNHYHPMDTIRRLPEKHVTHWLFDGGPNKPRSNPIWRTAAMLKIAKSR